jgi:hypothetical protein
MKTKITNMAIEVTHIFLTQLDLNAQVPCLAADMSIMIDRHNNKHVKHKNKNTKTSLGTAQPGPIRRIL